MQVRALSWNLFHGRDGPPNRALYTLRSKLLRITERNDTHVQVNRDLFADFASQLAAASWDVALLQECPPRWARPLASACGAEPHRVLTSRNLIPPLQGAIHHLNPDLMGSWEGGSNTTLVRGAGIEERRELVIRPGAPERRTMAFTRIGGGPCVANLHASNDDYPLAEEEVRLAAGTAAAWAGERPLILGGDFNLRPDRSPLFEELAERFQLRPATAPDAIDHMLARGIEVREHPRRWKPPAYEIPWDGLLLRLSDHAPVEALFAASTASASSA